VTAALGGFDAWLSGNPGKPAPKSEQQRFEAANGRTWAAFPRDTKLRELIRTTVARKTYVLFGFRSGKSICLRLRAISLGHTAEPMCAPTSTLAHVTAPFLIVDGDDGFQDRHARPSAEVSFGLAADGVQRVDIRAVDGTHAAIVGGNAYLWVENEPNTGNRVLSITAVGANGHRTTIPLNARFALGPPIAVPPRTPPGPTHVEARIQHPRIGWYLRGEPRGFSPPHESGLRLVKPDPLSDLAVGLTGRYCLAMSVGVPRSLGTSCSDPKDFFGRGAMNVSLQGTTGEFVALGGAAADGITTVKLFLADGERQSVPLKDNLFGALVAQTALPARVVGYNARGQVVGINIFGQLFGSAPASALRHFHVVLRVRGLSGTTAVAKVGRAARGVRCWRVDFSTGQTARGCMQLFPTGPWVNINLVQPAGRDLFVIGQTRPPVTMVEFHFQDGRVVQIRPVAGMFVAAIPRAYLRSERQVAYAVGYTARHRVQQRQGFVFRLRR
ncbi:MAG: hypothetical protein WAQ33_00155, partial [Gaiellaceae bacterium]